MEELSLLQFFVYSFNYLFISGRICEHLCYAVGYHPLYPVIFLVKSLQLWPKELLQVGPCVLSTSAMCFKFVLIFLFHKMFQAQLVFPAAALKSPFSPRAPGSFCRQTSETLWVQLQIPQ